MTGVPLELAMQVAFSDVKHAVGMTMTPERLTFFWIKPVITEVTGYSDLPKMDWEAAKAVVLSWQANVASYGPQPDHDGDNGKGLRVFNEAWARIGRMYQAFVAFEPTWIMYGK